MTNKIYYKKRTRTHYVLVAAALVRNQWTFAASVAYSASTLNHLHILSYPVRHPLSFHLPLTVSPICVSEF